MSGSSVTCPHKRINYSCPLTCADCGIELPGGGIKVLSVVEHMKLRPGFYARMGITLTEFDEAPEGLEFTRASGEVECQTCKKLYQWHNVETYGKDPSMQLVLHVLCNGKRVKL